MTFRSRPASARLTRHAVALAKEAKKAPVDLVARCLQGAINRGAFERYPLARPIERPVQDGAPVGAEEGVEGERHAPAAIVGQDYIADVVGRCCPFEIDARRRALS